MTMIVPRRPLPPVNRLAENVRRARARSSGRALGAALLLLAACGGKVTHDQAPESVPDPESGGDESAVTHAPPTCVAICAHVIGACAAGASTSSCVSECESTPATTSCASQRDAFLTCMLTVPVECARGGSVVIAGCSDERNALERCAP